MRGFGYRHFQILFIDSLSLIVVVVNLMTMLRHTELVGKLMKALVLALDILWRGIVFWLFVHLGLCFFTMAIYGNRLQRFSNFISAYLHLVYANASLSPQGEETMTLVEFFFFMLNHLIFYVMWIILMGVSLISLNGEYKSELLLYSPPSYV